MQRIGTWLGLLIAVLLVPMEARSAELRLSYAELARLVGGIFGDAKIYLNSQPGFLGFTTKSNVTFSGQKLEFDMPALARQIGGSQYVYHVTDINSTSVRISAVSGALRIAVTFEQDGPEVVGTCTSGPCFLANSLPQIEWSSPSVTVDLTPSDFGGSLSLMVRRVKVGGSLALVCVDGANVGCNVAAVMARSRIASFKSDLDTVVRQRVNSTEGQKAIADGIRPRLVVGPAGPVTISSVSSDQRGVVVSFQLAAAP